MADDADDPDAPAELTEEFRVAVARELRAMGYSVTRWDPEGFDCVSADGETRTVGLANLWRRARRGDPADWPEAIRDFLGVVALDGDDAIEAPESLDEVADRLLVRIGPPFDTSSEVAPWQKRLPGTDLALNLVIDADKYMMYVTA